MKYAPHFSPVTASWIKVIAMVTMLIDHTAAIVLLPILQDSQAFPFSAATIENLGWIYYWMRMIGRIAFPLYAFQIVEGCLKTSNQKAYLQRLLLFSLVAEIPFDLAFHHSIFSLSGQNVMFTLLFGALAIFVYQYHFKSSYGWLNYVLPLVLIGLAEFMQTDYGGKGVAFIIILYNLYRLLPRWLPVIAGTLFYLIYNQWTAWLAFLFMALYNGQRGLLRGRWVYFFYPLHLVILVGIKALI
ncbi:TraX family protein [Hutsoniella sourekii]